MSNQRKLYLLAACLAGVLMLMYTSMVQAGTPACGATLTKNTKLNSDMICPSRAINFSGPRSRNVVLDCAGFSISTTSDRVINASSVSGITIKNCMISTSHDGGRGIQFTGVNEE